MTKNGLTTKYYNYPTHFDQGETHIRCGHHIETGSPVLVFGGGFRRRDGHRNFCGNHGHVAASALEVRKAMRWYQKLLTISAHVLSELNLR